MDDTTRPVLEQSALDAFRLIVLMGEQVQTHPLPQMTKVVLGRGSSATIHIEDAGISRKHAVIHVNIPLKIEDLGSINGTRLRGRPLKPNEPTEFHPGDLIELGNAVVIVQPKGTSGRPRRIWKHDYFEGRIEEECARAQRQGTRFTLLRLHLEAPANAATLYEEILSATLRVEDCCSIYGPNEYELLLLDSDAAATALVVERLQTGLRQAGAQCTIGTARFPDDGLSPEQLLSVANAAVQGVEELPPPQPDQVVIQDEGMRRLYDLIDRIGTSQIGVLLLGETGVGKEIVAEAVHRRSSRASKPFVRINCAAVAESLFESELFGHEKGSFTGAVGSKAGLLETAQGGTVFLDEIGELSLAMQSKLLRVIELKEVQRVGGLKPRSIDVRFVAATNQDLEARSLNGTFRQDLYFRLNGMTLMIPPLRKRVSEIPGLANQFIANTCEQAGRPNRPRISPAAMEMLKRYPWPGNIRELRNVIDRAVLLCGDGPIQPEHLPVEKMKMSVTGQAPLVEMTPPGFRLPPSKPRPAGMVPPPQNRESGAERVSYSNPAVTLAGNGKVDKAAVISALEITGGNQTKAAELLGISRRTLVTRIKEYGLPRPRGE